MRIYQQWIHTSPRKGEDARVRSIDLLTAVMHELGHVVGLDHLDDDEHDLMFWSLEPGVRKTSLEASAADEAIAEL